MTFIDAPNHATPSPRHSAGRPDVSRRFGLLDVLLLVMAMALGLGFTRSVMGAEALAFESGMSASSVGLQALGIASPCLGFMSLAAVAIQMRKPRAPMRRLVRQPGFVSVLGTCPGYALSLIVLAILVFHTSSFASEIFIILCPLMGFSSMVGALMIQRIGGRCRLASGPVEAVNRFLGASWLVAAIAATWLLWN